MVTAPRNLSGWASTARSAGCSSFYCSPLTTNLGGALRTPYYPGTAPAQPCLKEVRESLLWVVPVKCSWARGAIDCPSPQFVGSNFTSVVIPNGSGCFCSACRQNRYTLSACRHEPIAFVFWLTGANWSNRGTAHSFSVFDWPLSQGSPCGHLTPSTVFLWIASRKIPFGAEAEQLKGHFKASADFSWLSWLLWQDL